MALTRAALAEALHIPPAEIGAPPPAGWADDIFIVALHCSGSLLAVAGQQCAIIFRSDGPIVDATWTLAPASAATVCSAAERVTAATWAAFPGQQEDSCLVLGTSGGWLQLHSVAGTLLHRQQLHALPVLQLSVRAPGMGVNVGDDVASDVTVIFADAAARISGLEIRSVVRLQQSSWSDPERLDPLGFTKWDLKAAGPRTAGVCVGSRPPTLQALMKGGYTAPKLTLATVGAKPPIASFEVEEHAQRGAIAMVTDIAASLKGWIPSPMRRAKREARLQPAEPAVLATELRDDKTRVLTSLLLAPQGAMAVATDSLGRVMLLDVAAMAVVRLWKGYRDAQCAWLVLPSPPAQPSPQQGGAQSPAGAGTGARSRKRAKQELVAGFEAAAGTEVHLVVYAPRRSVFDVYRGRHGPALHTLPCGGNCRLLQPSPALGGGGGGVAASGGGVADCLLLDFDSGALMSVRRQLPGGG